jgi:hypothetical protein
MSSTCIHSHRVASVFELIFQQDLLDPKACVGLALASKDLYDILEKYRRTYPFKSVQDLVHKHGFFLDSIEAFEFAIQNGYVVWDMSAAFLVRNNAPWEVVAHCMSRNQNRINASTIVEAWVKSRPYFDSLYSRASVDVRCEVDEWIVHLQRTNRREIQL